MELSDSHIIEGGFFVSSLTITAAAREDVGVYNCTAINSVGSDSATFNLLVLGMLSLRVALCALIRNI